MHTSTFWTLTTVAAVIGMLMVSYFSHILGEDEEQTKQSWVDLEWLQANVRVSRGVEGWAHSEFYVPRSKNVNTNRRFRALIYPKIE